MVNQLFRINIAAGISLKINNDGTITVNACCISRQNNQLEFVQKLTDLNSFDELKGKLDDKLPVALNIAGKGILYKQIGGIVHIDAISFAQVLPNAAFDDFYVQNFVSGNQSFLSIIRKADADKWVSQLKELGFNVVMLSLGGFAASAVLPQLNIYNEEVSFDGHILTRNEQKDWLSYRYKEGTSTTFPLKIESEKIEEGLVMAYAPAFQLLTGRQLEPVQVSVPQLDKQYKDVLSWRWVKGYGTIALVVTFILLLANLLVFSWVDADNTKLAIQASRSARNTQDVKGIEDEVKTKEEKLKALGWIGGINKAYLIDQLASVLPDEITWRSVEVNPQDIAGSRAHKNMLFKDRQVQITGDSPQIIPVNEWMARIKTQKWVKSIQLENYSFNQELNTGQFNLTINY